MLSILRTIQVLRKKHDLKVSKGQSDLKYQFLDYLLVTQIAPSQIRGGCDGQLCGHQDEPSDALESGVHERGVQ